MSGNLYIVWVGTILDGIFWIGLIWVAIILGGNFTGGNYPEWELFGGNHPSGNFLGWRFPSSKQYLISQQSDRNCSFFQTSHDFTLNFKGSKIP